MASFSGGTDIVTNLENSTVEVSIMVPPLKTRKFDGNSERGFTTAQFSAYLGTFTRP